MSTVVVTLGSGTNVDVHPEDKNPLAVCPAQDLCPGINPFGEGRLVALPVDENSPWGAGYGLV